MLEGIVRSDVLSEALNAVSVLVDDCKIQTNADGLYIETMDPATVGAIELELGAGAFESYEATEGVMGVDVSRLEDILGMVDSDELVRLEEDDETRSLHIRSGGMEYKLALIDPSAIRDRPDLERIDLPAHVVIQGDVFERAVKTADMVSDHLDLGVDESEPAFYVDAEGDVDETHFGFGEDELVDLTVGPAHSKYSVRYLVDILKGVPSNAPLEIELGEEMPAEFHYDFAEGDGEVTYFLAPRLSST